MKKLKYVSSEAPTPWGMVKMPHLSVPALPPNYPKEDIPRLQASDDRYMELALKSWIPIRIEDQEKVKSIIWDSLSEGHPYPTLKDWKPESKLYDIPDGSMEFYIKEETESCMCTDSCGYGLGSYDNCKALKRTKKFYVLKSKEEKCDDCEHLGRKCQKHKEVEEKPKEEASDIIKLASRVRQLETFLRKWYWQCCDEGSVFKIHDLEIQINEILSGDVEDTKKTDILHNKIEELARPKGVELNRLYKENDELKQRREELITKLMNAEDYIKSLETKETESQEEIKKIEWLIWHGVQATCEEECKCHAECNKADNFIENFKSKYRISRIK